MSISLTIYDFFGNLIPGLLYLYVMNEALLAFGQRSIDLNQLDKLSHMFLAAVAAFVLGNIFRGVSSQFWYRLFVRKDLNDQALEHVKKRCAPIPVHFGAHDASLLFRLLRQHTPKTAHTCEIFRATAIMMRNISLGLAFYALLQVALMVRDMQFMPYALIAAAALALSAAALNRCKMNEYWYYCEILYQAMSFGSSLEEVLAVARKLSAKVADEKPENELQPARAFE